jgi:type IV pilus assembly protein PilO
MPRSFDLGGLVRDPKLAVRIILGVLLAANLVAAAFVLFPPGGSAETLEREYAGLQAQVRARQAVLEKTRQHAAAVEKGRAEGDHFLKDYFLPSRSYMSALLTELGTAAAQSKIKPREQSYAIEPIEGSDSLSMLTITAGYEGTYADLMRFVHEIDQSSRLLIIESLNAQPEQGAGLLAISIKFDAFVREDSGDIIAVARPEAGSGASQ